MKESVLKIVITIVFLFLNHKTTTTTTTTYVDSNCEIPAGCRFDLVYSFDQQMLKENFKTRTYKGVLCDFQNQSFSFKINQSAFHNPSGCNIFGPDERKTSINLIFFKIKRIINNFFHSLNNRTHFLTSN